MRSRQHVKAERPQRSLSRFRYVHDCHRYRMGVWASLSPRQVTDVTVEYSACQACKRRWRRGAPSLAATALDSLEGQAWTRRRRRGTNSHISLGRTSTRCPSLVRLLGSESTLSPLLDHDPLHLDVARRRGNPRSRRHSLGQELLPSSNTVAATAFGLATIEGSRGDDRGIRWRPTEDRVVRPDCKRGSLPPESGKEVRALEWSLH